MTSTYKYDILQASSNSNVAVIGDVHECVDELALLLAQIPKNTQVYLNGDWIDKGFKTKKIIDFLLLNPQIKLIKGNHEAFVYRALIDPKYVYELTEVSIHFTSLGWLYNKPEYIEKFLSLYARSLDFVQVNDDLNKPLAYISHSPCFNKHLGQLDSKSITAMQKMRFRWDTPILNQLSWLYKEANINDPLHIFGHINVDKSNHIYLNKVAIDQACVEGGSLTACLFNTGNVKDLKFIYQHNLKKTRPVSPFPLIISID